ncbi:hypothetical protein ES319_D10G263700v1 [Gossypium barbadense]|uniref:Uncharacterized protein n=1 Tax=Gossypium barbadense TaxID=3634 RepID=A0A5J5PWA8_GOSBA|nr:hypothetical protein ES319_D10G263700v1 [Gossypium barbadense]
MLVTSPKIRTQTNETLFLCLFFILHHFLYLFRDLPVHCRHPVVNITFDLFAVSLSCINRMLHSVPCIFQLLSLVLEGLNILLMIGKVFDMVYDRRNRILCSFSENRANDANNELH